MKTGFILTVFATVSACAAGAAPTAASSNNPIPVKIVTGADDGYTQRLSDAVRGKFEKSAAFTLAPASATNALIVTIPTHVEWQDVGRKRRISYKLRLERAGHLLEETAGTCWENELHVCAESIVDAAGGAVKRQRPLSPSLLTLAECLHPQLSERGRLTWAAHAIRPSGASAV